VPSTFAGKAATSGHKPLTRRIPPAPPASMSASLALMKPASIHSTAGPSTVPVTVPPPAQSTGPSDVPSTMKDKGKGHAAPGPYINEMPKGMLSFEEDPYGYSLEFDNDKFNDLNYDADQVCAAVLDTTRCMTVILSGTASTGNSGSSETGGREPAVLRPKTMAEFRLAYDALDTTLCNVVTSAHKAGKNKFQLEKGIVDIWQVPDWQASTKPKGKSFPWALPEPNSASIMNGVIDKC
jgi:hypothetical protein